MRVLTRERARLENGWSVEAEFHAGDANGPSGPMGSFPHIRVCDVAGKVIYRGVAPPVAARRPPVGSPREPGLDVDVVWTIVDGVVGPFAWRQCFRDGLECEAPGPAPLRFGIRVSYSALIAVLYAGRRFEDAIGPDRVARDFSVYSCVAGLVHEPSAPRLTVFDPPTVAALITWAALGGSVGPAQS